jgi:hypothetical protein
VVGGVGGQVVKEVAQAFERVDVVASATGDEAEEDRGGLASFAHAGQSWGAQSVRCSWAKAPYAELYVAKTIARKPIETLYGLIGIRSLVGPSLLGSSRI